MRKKLKMAFLLFLKKFTKVVDLINVETEKLGATKIHQSVLAGV